MTLDEIALKYKTDKSSKVHNYTGKYEVYFSSIKNNNLKILEIGIQNGYSLKTWKEYFANSEIYGIDIKDCSKMDEDRIKTLKGSQDDLVFLKTVNDKYGPFDIIIDDGSHFNDHMKTSFDFFFPFLKNGGFYVVEDLNCCYRPDFRRDNTLFMNRLKELLDCVNSGGKCGIADISNIKEDNFYQRKELGELNWWEKSIDSIHLYRSIVFIKKYKFAEKFYEKISPSYILWTNKALSFGGKIFWKIRNKVKNI